MSGLVIVGAGQAAAVATRTLRRRGYDGTVTLLGDESHRPYQRPPLSKEFLTAGDESGLDLLPEDWTETQGVRVRTDTRVERVDTTSGSVVLASGERIAADDVLLATGGRARTLPDTEGDRIFYLRNRDDAARLRDCLSGASRLVVVGAGFVGAEVASSALALGVEVVVVEAAKVPLEAVLGQTLGAACAALQSAAGVDLRLGEQVTSVTQHGAEVVVETDRGSVTADLVVIGIGIVPNDEVARASGLQVANGILVDERCRTSNPHVYAAGDVANHWHPLFGTRMRVEHFDNASKQGAAAANNMIGRSTVFADPHWFWSDQFGVNLQYAGHAGPSDELLVRGSTEDPAWSAFFVRDGRVNAAFAVDSAEDVLVAKELIVARATLDPAQLTDPDTDLMELLEQL